MSSTPTPRRFAPDADVRQRVTDPRQSFIVKAPAGSGKTELLAQRFLRLLLTVEEPESVLAITFTRKAASEMRNRIIDALRQSMQSTSGEELRNLDPHKQERRRLAAEVLQRDAGRGWNLLLNPQRLQIRTVDSFCDSAARQLPLLAGLGSELQVTEDSHPLYREAADRTISALGSRSDKHVQAIADLLSYCDNRVGRVRELLVSMLAKRDQWMRILGRSDNLTEDELTAQRERLERALRNCIEAELRRLRAEVSSLLSASDVSRIIQLAALADPFVNKAAANVAQCAGLPSASPDALPQWRAWKQFLLTESTGTIRKSFDARTGYNGADRDLCKDFFVPLGESQAAERLCVAFTRAAKLPAPQYSDADWRFIRSLLIALPLSVANLKVVFAEHSTVDFLEMSQAAIAALRTPEGPTELGLALGSQIRHLLIDEFQDTSKSQMDLIAVLTAGWEPDGGNTLFVVGDPMQSIYAFREAEVGIFTSAFREAAVGDVHFQWAVSPQALTANFRSQAGLVNWFNQVFPSIFGDENDATGAVTYSASEPVRPALPADAVTMDAFPTAAYELEGQRVAALVAQALAEDATQSIAVLVRARTHLPHVVSALKAASIPFRAVKTDYLGKRQIVRDLDALSRALLNLADRTAWLAVLRAPWCGLTLADLWELCRGGHERTLWELLNERSPSLSSDARQRLERVLPILDRALCERGRVPIRMWVERAWTSLGGPAALHPEDRDSQMRDAEAFFNFLDEQAELHELPGTRRFTEQLQDLYAPADTSPGIRVEVTTIHNAKGLEWDVVIVPCLGRKPQRDETQLLYWREQVRGDSDELLLAPMEAIGSGEERPSFQKLLERMARERSSQETRRLLYVACTRARRRLHLTATAPKNNKPNSASLLELLWSTPSVRAPFEALAPAAETSAKKPTQLRTTLRRLSPDWQLPASPPGVEWKRPAASAATDGDPHTFDWVGETRRRIGTVTHAFLQEIAREGSGAWTPERVRRMEPTVRAALTTSGVGPDRLADAATEVISALANTLEDRNGRWILAAHPESASEFAITAVMDGAPKRVKVDRTFVADGIRWVVDFKVTDAASATESFIDSQVSKYRDDLERYARALQLFDPRPVRCGLYFPLQKIWRPVTLTER